jgi:hypothetical protein
MISVWKYIPLILILVEIGMLGWFLVGYFKAPPQAATPEQKEIIAYVQENVNINPITSIFIKPGSCDAGYEQHPIGSFAGVNSGCACDDFTSYKPGPGDPCPGNCVSVAPAIGSALNIWGKGNKVCVKRAVSVRYLEGGNKACPSAFKKCSVNICVGQLEECPLVDAQIIKKPGAARRSAIWQHLSGHHTNRLQRDAIPADYQSTLIGDQIEPGTVAHKNFDDKDRLLVVKRGSDQETGPLLSAISTTGGGVSCVSPLKNEKRSSGKSFDLEKVERKGCGAYGSDNKFSMQIDMGSEVALYRENGIVLTSGFLQFLNSNNEQAILQVRRKIFTPTASACQQVSQETPVRIDNSLKEIWASFKTFCLVFGILVGVACLCQILIFCISQVRTARVMTIITSAVIFLGGVAIIYQYFSFKTKRKEVEPFLLQLQGCIVSDPYNRPYDELKASYNTVLQQSDQRNDISIWLGGILVAGGLLYSVLMYQARYVRKHYGAGDESVAFPSAMTPQQMY